MALSRITTALSVRKRLIVLALVPVFGFAAIGFAYVSSERTVEAAFDSVIKLFARSLVPDGYLFLGHSESLIDRTSEFEPVVDGSVIYRRAAAA